MKLYDINEKGITIYKYGVYKAWQWALITVMVPAIFYFLHYPVGYCLLLLCVMPPVFFILHHTSIVFDLDKRAVFRQLPLAGRTKLIDFTDIQTIEYVRNAIGGRSPGHYRIATRSNPYGKGIAILNMAESNKPEIIDFASQCLPRLLACIRVAEAVVSVPHYEAPRAPEAVHVEDRSAIANEMEMSNLCYLKESEDGVFTYQELRMKSVFINGFLLLLGIIGCYSFASEPGNNTLYILVCVFLIPLALWNFYGETKSFVFDCRNRVLTVSHIFGWGRKEYSFQAFQRFNITRNTLNFIYKGTDLSMEMSGSPAIGIASFYDTQKLEDMMNEIKWALSY